MNKIKDQSWREQIANDNIREMTVPFGGHKIKFFIAGTAPVHERTPIGTHKHFDVEVHMISDGNAVYIIDNKRYEVKCGDFVVIPGMTFHRYIPADSFSFLAFRIKQFDTSVNVYHAPTEVFSDIISEFSRFSETRPCGKLASSLAYLLRDILPEGDDTPTPLQDRKYMICEMLSVFYNKDITLEDVAQKLKLSPKQTARLIVESTGNSFRQEIPRLRIEAAQHLMESEDLTLEEVAELVGYSSYSSFWKAYHRYLTSNR